MSMRKQPLGAIPQNTAQVARRVFRKGNIYMKIADEIGTIYEFSDFAELFPTTGQSAENPVRLFLVSILQFAEGLSDREAAETVRARIDWKYLLHLDLEDEGFDFSVLSEFRSRLVEHEAAEKLFDKLVITLKERGFIKSRGKQRTDSTHVLAVIRDLNRLELVHETMRNALENLATVAATWLISKASPHDTDARFSMKQSTEWRGYKLHLTETCDEGLPRCITNVATTPATRPDWGILPEVHKSLKRIDLLPADHLVDTGYVTAESIVSSNRDYKVRVIGPPMEDSSWQAQEKGFDKSYFDINWKKRTATCPGKKKNRSWNTHKDGMTDIRFQPSDCFQRKFSEICVRGETEAGWPKARHLLLKPQLEHEALMTARALMNDEDFWLRYRERSGIEGTISPAVRTCGARISRYIGSKKMALQNTLIGLATNVTRLGVWLSGTPLAKTRKSKLETVCAA